MKGLVAILAMSVAVMLIFSLMLPVRSGDHHPYISVVAE